MKELIQNLRCKPHYIKLLNILVLNGLLDIIEYELKDDRVNYIELTLNIVEFLNKNKKHYTRFSSEKFHKIIILCADEILTKKFKIDLDSEQLESILKLLKNSYLIKMVYYRIRDFFVNVYNGIKCNNCKNTGVIQVLDSI